MLPFQKQLQLVSNLNPIYLHALLLIVGYDFSTAPLTAKFPAGATNTTVRVAVTNDNIVEGDEMFSMSLNVSSYLGSKIVAGLITNATGIIIDTTGMYIAS